MKNNFFIKNNLQIFIRNHQNYLKSLHKFLYGEKFKILSKKKNWLKIKTSFDNYIGYIKNKNYSKVIYNHKVFVLKQIFLIILKKKQKIICPLHQRFLL